MSIMACFLIFRIWYINYFIENMEKECCIKCRKIIYEIKIHIERNVYCFDCGFPILIEREKLEEKNEKWNS